MLKAQGYRFRVIKPMAAEVAYSPKGPVHAALKNSRAKAEVVGKKYPGKIILSADTIVVLGKKILGKPKNKKQSLEMLIRLNGKTHSVITAYTIGVAKNKGLKIIDEKAVVSFVTFGNFSDVEYDHYERTGEPSDKAGAYGIQGLGSRFIKSVKGSHTNIAGLPMFEVMQGLKKAGVKYPWK